MIYRKLNDENVFNVLLCFFLLICGCSSVVEHHVANVRVVSSNLITRFFYFINLGASIVTEQGTLQKYNQEFTNELDPRYKSTANRLPC